MSKIPRLARKLVGELPKEWCYARFKELYAKPIRDFGSFSSTKLITFLSDGVPFIKSEMIHRGRIRSRNQNKSHDDDRDRGFRYRSNASSAWCNCRDPTGLSRKARLWVILDLYFERPCKTAHALFELRFSDACVLSIAVAFGVWRNH